MPYMDPMGIFFFLVFHVYVPVFLTPERPQTLALSLPTRHHPRSIECLDGRC